MLPLKVSCPKCGTRYQIDRSHAGKVFTCKHCRSKIATEATLPTIPPKMEEAPGTTRPKTSWNVGEEILNIYQVKDLLGEGGMGKVFRIYHKKWDVDIAVKSPHPNLMMSEQAVHTFVAEAETWVNLGVHPHIVSCYYVRTIDDIPRVFAECVEGGSLRDWIRSQDEQDECGTDKALEKDFALKNNTEKLAKS